MARRNAPAPVLHLPRTVFGIGVHEEISVIAVDRVVVNGVGAFYPCAVSPASTVCPKPSTRPDGSRTAISFTP